jgi:hypothetical protein
MLQQADHTRDPNSNPTTTEELEEHIVVLREGLCEILDVFNQHRPQLEVAQPLQEGVRRSTVPLPPPC